MLMFMILESFSILSCYLFSQDGMVTMHDVLDAQYLLDNMRDGMLTDSAALSHLN